MGHPTGCTPQSLDRLTLPLPWVLLPHPDTGTPGSTLRHALPDHPSGGWGVGRGRRGVAWRGVAWHGEGWGLWGGVGWWWGWGSGSWWVGMGGVGAGLCWGCGVAWGWVWGGGWRVRPGVAWCAGRGARGVGMLVCEEASVALCGVVWGGVGWGGVGCAVRYSAWWVGVALLHTHLPLARNACCDCALRNA